MACGMKSNISVYGVERGGKPKYDTGVLLVLTVVFSVPDPIKRHHIRENNVI